MNKTCVESKVRRLGNVKIRMCKNISAILINPGLVLQSGSWKTATCNCGSPCSMLAPCGDQRETKTPQNISAILINPGLVLQSGSWKTATCNCGSPCSILAPCGEQRETKTPQNTRLQDKILVSRKFLPGNDFRLVKQPQAWKNRPLRKIYSVRESYGWNSGLLRMKISRWPRKICQWTSHGRRRRGRPQQSWRNQVTDFMRSRNLEEDMADDRRIWRLRVDG